jgi:mono/diheme cytochrome c family protein
VNRNDVILGVFTAVLVVFSLVVALVIPRRDPGFPGRKLRFFVVLSALLIACLLGAVEVLGESHDFGEAHGETGGVAEPAPTGTGATTGETGTTTGETGTTTGEAQGDPQAGEQIFTSVADPACATCHTLQAAGASGTLGPNLDEVLADKDAAFIHESILDPNAEIATGFQAGLMPQDYGEKLTEQQLNDLVAFLVQATQE